MDDQRLDDFLGLIKTILNSPPEKTEEILSNNQHLIQKNLIQAMKDYSILLNRLNEQSKAKYLSEVATKLDKGEFNLDKKTPVKAVATPEATKSFFYQLLRTIHESNGDTQIIHSLLIENLDKLNHSFPTIMEEWAIAILEKMETDKKLEFAQRLNHLCRSISTFTDGESAPKLEILLSVYKILTDIYDPNSSAIAWAETQFCLGKTYLERIDGNKSENIEAAIKCFSEPLTIYSDTEFLEQWLSLQENLGIAYCQRIERNKIENVQKAIDIFTTALEACPKEKFPKQWESLRFQCNQAHRQFIILAARGETTTVKKKPLTPLITEASSFKLGEVLNFEGDNPLGISPLGMSPGQDSLAVWTKVLQAPISKTAYQGLTDNQLWHMVTQILSSLSGKTNEKIEQILQTVNNIALTTIPESASQEMKRFWGELLLATTTFPTAQVVYPLLQANAKKLNSQFITFLESWVKSIISELQELGETTETVSTVSETRSLSSSLVSNQSTRQTPSQIFAGVIGNFSNLIWQFSLGDTEINLEIAISGYEMISQIFSREASPIYWASLQTNLGNAYLQRTQGNRQENLEKALLATQSALEVYNQTDFPLQWADNQNNLGIINLYRQAENRGENLENAILATQAAAEFYHPDQYPNEWAVTQNTLATIYLYIEENRAENIETAITTYKAALEVIKPQTSLQLWGQIHLNLGKVYLNRIEGKLEDNLAAAISTCSTALEIINKEYLPEIWAKLQLALGNVYRQYQQGNKKDNLKSAINAYEAALQVYTQQEFPYLWALVQTHLSLVYIHQEYYIEAITACSKALQIYTLKAYPYEWAITQTTLGHSYLEDKNPEEAMRAYQAALQVYNQNDYPYQWAEIYHCLGLVYELQENWEEAIAYFQTALQIRSCENLPQEYIETSYHLGFCQKANQQLNSAYTTLALAVDSVEFLRTHSLKFIPQLYNSLIQTCLQLAINDSSYYAKAFEYAERYKTYTIVKHLVSLHINSKENNIPDHIIQAVEQQQKNLAIEIRKINILYSQINIISDTKTNISYSDLLFAFKQFAQLRQQLDTLINQEIQAFDSSFPMSQQIYPLSLPEIQASLPDENTALVSWYFPPEQEDDNSFITFIVTQHETYPTVLGLLSDKFQEWKKWLKDYLTTYEKRRSQWKDELTSQLTKLGKILQIDKIMSELDNNCARLLLVPHNYLSIIPIHAIPEQDESYLSDHFYAGIHFIPNCQFLLQTQLQHNPYYPNKLINFVQHSSEITDILPSTPFNSEEILNIEQSLTFDEICKVKFNSYQLINLPISQLNQRVAENIEHEYIDFMVAFIYTNSPQIIYNMWELDILSQHLFIIKFSELIKTDANWDTALYKTQKWLRNTTLDDLEEWIDNLPLSRNFKEELTDKLYQRSNDTHFPLFLPYDWASFSILGYSKH
jgi:tetratricopeptide (TPR) repeat protein